MRVLFVRGFVLLALGCWSLSGVFGQLVLLHVETEHHGHRHAVPHGPVLVPHAEDHVGHEHQLSTLPGSGLRAPGPHVLPPVLASLPLEWSTPVPRHSHRPLSIPRTRGSPQLRTILLI